MNANYFSIYQDGMAGQLQVLSLAEMNLYVRNHIHNFLLDESVCFCFIERYANDPETVKNEQAQRVLLYLLDKGLQQRPFRPGLLSAVARLTGNPAVQQRMEAVEAHNHDPETYGMISALDIRKDGKDALSFATQLIQKYPDHMPCAQFALAVDRYLGIPMSNWRKSFVCPPALRRDWEIALFDHHAALGDYEEAAAMWPSLRKEMLRETSFNLAAEMFIARGELEAGLELYRVSLKQDPRQTPVKLRMQELENPFTPDASLLEKCKVDICLYSWNKADVLADTLQSLSESDIGPARINVLLNGCTDHSRDVVDKARSLFPDNEFIVHDLHVNIGAPAARNWLLRLPEVQQSDYIAFLDDDVTVQKDWLAQFLTVAERDETIGVVGCKIVDAGKLANFQYLYRYVAIADHGLLKMSIHCPPGTFDNHAYDFTRETRSVMGCQHLLRTSALKNITAGFDIRFSPSQVDDIDHDLAICLEGYKVMYCGTVSCIHHQTTAIKQDEVKNIMSAGATMGNDIKFYFKHFGQMDKIKALDNLSLDLGVPAPEI